ncbi:hypothetical protein AB0D67_23440 [Streptosporangium sp. NPDC048047]|uniref:hypothetical protein n=1 Tax=Streptosporangium sp. NPDC048047 TaxID=3155748 RepID=UPI0034418C45
MSDILSPQHTSILRLLRERSQLAETVLRAFLGDEALAAALAELPADHALKRYKDVCDMSVSEAQPASEEEEEFHGWPVYSPFGRLHYGQGLRDGLREGAEKGRPEVRAEGKTEGRAEGLVEGRAEGRIEGRTEEATRLVLLVMAARGFAVSDEAHTRITSCTDLTRLEAWVIRAATAQTAHDLLHETNEQDR